MESFKDSDPVQELYQEIENLIDGNTLKETSSIKENEHTFERPILIESDSDEMEE
ncbi:hypothetical protein RMATCC62417_15246 [Rhizopus microsporus]|nr:hypothetical protein RMATCC62417_15246 [Rhizopus microsporus]